MTDGLVGSVVRIRERASHTFGGCIALVKEARGEVVGVEILAPSMAEGNGPWWFRLAEVSTSREDWP